MKNKNVTPFEIFSIVFSCACCLIFYVLIIAGTFDILFFTEEITKKILWFVVTAPIPIDLILLKNHRAKKETGADYKKDFLWVLLIIDLSYLAQWYSLTRVTFTDESPMKFFNTFVIFMFFTCLQIVLVIIDRHILKEDLKAH